MSSLGVLVGAQECTFALAEQRYVVPVGIATLNHDQLAGDPPPAEELTNAIGAVLDHLDDVVRELPGVLDAEEVLVAGPEQYAIACVEVGRTVELPLTLDRDAAEEVFRTVATERRVDRARNPGLAPDHLDTIVAGCCVLVAIMRRLRLETITITTEADAFAGSSAPADEDPR